MKQGFGALLFAGAVMSAATAVADEELIYVAVDPCRIADTRQSALGVVRADTFRNFRIAGSSQELSSQGGTADCESPLDDLEPVAVAAYVLAVPAESSSDRGVLTAYPSDEPPPPTGSGSTVNFAQGQVIGNTTIVSVCSDDCPADGELAVLARKTDEHVVIDVQGYFYPHRPLPGYEIAVANFATANSSSVTAEALCADGKRVLGGGGNLGVSSTWYMDGSYPRTDGAGWRVRYRTTGANFSVSGSVWAICIDKD